MIATMVETFGEKLKRLRLAAGLTQARLAELSGVERSYITLLETSQRKGRISMATAVRLATALEVEPGEFFEGALTDMAPAPPKSISSLWHEFQERYEALEVVEIPVRGVIPAGTPFPNDEVNEGPIEIPRDALGGVKNVDKLYAVKVAGHSLAGDDISDGDWAIVDPDSVFMDGKIYAVRIGSEVVARHVFKDDGHVRLVSSDGVSQEIKARELDILGRVILSGHWKKQ
jgi:SOS-response transcriptional repressor LexA